MAGRKKKKKRGGFAGFMLRLERMLLVMLGLLTVLFVIYAVSHQDLRVTTRDLTLDMSQNLTADDFVVTEEKKKRTITFAQAPVKVEGTQEVTIVVKNRWNITKEYKKELTYFQTDFEAPTILGLHEMQMHVGETISYLDGIIANDAVDGAVPVTVDQSAVNTRVPGTYSVVYKASDATGNVTTAEANVVVTEMTATQQEVAALADRLLAKITDTSMSPGRKARAIYDYCRTHIRYTSSRLGTDWETEAYVGLNNLLNQDASEGDCHTSCAVSMVLLQQIGAQVMRIERSDIAAGRHYWVLCDLGNGWYHFDATRFDEKIGAFMLTDAQLATFNSVRTNYFVFDEWRYPVRAEAPFILE